MGSRRRVLPYSGTEKQPLCAHGITKRDSACTNYQAEKVI